MFLRRKVLLMKCVIATALLLLFTTASMGQSAKPPSQSSVRTHSNAKFVSPQGGLTAIVLASGKEKGFEKAESRVEIRGKNGAVLCSHDFSSPDGEHGYGVDGAQWTADSQFFVFRMRSAGGHNPMYAPLVVWSRSRNHFYHLDDYTGDQTFSVTSPDVVSVDTWPIMKPATISLSNLDTVR